MIFGIADGGGKIEGAIFPSCPNERFGRLLDTEIGIVAIGADDGVIIFGVGVSVGVGIIVEISVLTTGNPINPVFVIISPLCNVSAT